MLFYWAGNRWVASCVILLVKQPVGRILCYSIAQITGGPFFFQILKSEKNFRKSGKRRKILLSPIDLKITETILQIQTNKLSVFLTLESVPFLRYRRSKYKNPSNEQKRKNSPKTRCNLRIAEVSSMCTMYNSVNNTCSCSEYGKQIHAR